jgi:hypothetical protein
LLDRHGWPPSVRVWQSIAKPKKVPCIEDPLAPISAFAEH